MHFKWTFIKMCLVTILILLLSCGLCCSADANNCTLLSELEDALYTTKPNEQQLNLAFFPPRKDTSRYIKVNYDFLNEEGLNDNCTVTYVWAIGGFLLIQPPIIFQLTSLLFSYQANNIFSINLTLPFQCRNLINFNSDGNCSCENTTDNNLDILTQQIMQYSKFNNAEQIVRDVTSSAQALCFNNLEAGYFNHYNTLVFLFVLLILPISIFVVSLVILRKYNTKISEGITNPTTRPNIVGLFMTGLYITGYILSNDAAAIYYYGSYKNEYGEIKMNIPYSLFWTTITLSVECLLSSVVFLITFIAMTVKSLTRCGIIAFIVGLVVGAAIWMLFPFILAFLIISLFSTISDQMMIAFLPVPLILLSAHILYIFAAWLTEPSKTTSVALLALAFIVFLFVVHRSIYHLIVKKKFLKEGVNLFLTFIIGVVVATLLGLHILAFFILPLPTVRLADYIENIANIALIFLAALLTYKIISFQNSDATKFMKSFNQSYKTNTKSVPNVGTRSHLLRAELKGEVVLTSIQIEKGLPPACRDTAKLKFDKAVLTLKIPSRDDIIVPITKVELQIATFPHKRKEVHVPLATAKVKFCVPSSSMECKGNLENAYLMHNERKENKNYSASDIEVRLNLDEHDNKWTATLATSSILCDDTDIIHGGTLTLTIPLTCHVVKTLGSFDKNGICCQFNYLKVTQQSSKNYLLPIDCTSMRITQHEQAYYLELREIKKKFSLSDLQNVKLNRLSMLYSVPLKDIKFKYKYNSVQTTGQTPGQTPGEQQLILMDKKGRSLEVPMGYLSQKREIRIISSCKLKPKNLAIVHRVQNQADQGIQIAIENDSREAIESINFENEELKPINLPCIPSAHVPTCIRSAHVPTSLPCIPSAHVQWTLKNCDISFQYTSVSNQHRLNINFKDGDFNIRLSVNLLTVRDLGLTLNAEDITIYESSFLHFPNFCPVKELDDEFETAGSNCGTFASKISSNNIHH